MKALFYYLKVIFLTVITGGVYGAYWIIKNMSDEPDQTMGDNEKASRESQNTIALVWLHFINR